MTPSTLNRREFIAVAGTGSLLALTLASTATAADLPPLELTNPTAKALGYIEDSNKVDNKKYPNHKPDQLCNNCKFMVGDAKAARVGCTLFPGKSVTAKGWCVSWAKKA
jgi:hypothetical protein